MIGTRLWVLPSLSEVYGTGLPDTGSLHRWQTFWMGGEHKTGGGLRT